MARTARRRPPFAGGALASFPSLPVTGLLSGYADRIGSR